MAQVKKKQSNVGRPSIGDKAMTAAERVQKTREERKAAGIKDYSPRLKIKDVARLANRLGVSDKAAIEEAFQIGLEQLLSK